ncbi:MAG: tRNA guanosine(15) transglycosylase TgtA [Candidatus Hermodarchaeota archaeon]
MFSISKKDGLARIGLLLTQHGKIQTPVLLPVINPNQQILHLDDMIRSGAEAFITNAYLLYRNHENREKALNEGLHKYIGFNGPLMTDSGAFQLMEYGGVSVTNEKITKFQEQIGSDIGVFLDVPTKKGAFDEHKQALKETLQRADEHIRCRNPASSVLWAGPIQGGEYLDLVEHSCKKMREKDFHVHPIGSVVPLLEQYDFETVIRMILTSKRHLPSNRPVHLFGAGHPIFFAIAVLLGIDIFDSAAYIIYAKKNRYITEFGTNYLEKLQYLPCSCDVCHTTTVSELKKLDQETRTILLAKHNLFVSFEEMKRIKQAIIEGRLYELALSRAMNHPSLAKVLELIFGASTSHFIEPFDPISRTRSILISHPILEFQPLLQRYKQRVLSRFYHWSSRLIIAQEHQKIRSSSSYQVVKISPLFGIIPDELKGVFPLVQYERIPLSFSPDITMYISQFLEKYHSMFEKIEVYSTIKLDSEIFKNFETIEQIKKDNKLNNLHILNAIIDYQFGKGTHKIFDNEQIIIERSPKTGIFRRFLGESGLLGTFRASDFSIIPTKNFARRLHNFLYYPRMRVVAMEESIPFIIKNKDLLAKFVHDVDSDIRCGEEVFIIDKNDTFLNSGTSVLSALEMIEFNRGVAVRVRR